VRYYAWWTRFGGIGVDLFFVLSGYLISGLLFAEYKRTGNISVSRFLIRRAFKIYPAYFAMLLLLLPFTIHRVTWADFTFMGAYFPIQWGHAWSLSVEEHFYFALPFLLLISIRVFRCRNFFWVPWAMPLVASTCLVLRYRYALSHTSFLGITETHLRIDSLFAGVTLGWLEHFRKLTVRHPNLYGVAGLLLLLPYVGHLSAIASASVGFLLLTCGFSLILVWAVNCEWVGKLRPLAEIGFYSYSIYLWHVPVAQFFNMMSSTFASFWLYLGTCLLVGIVMARVIETPGLALRDRFFPSISADRDTARRPIGGAALTPAVP
jgi:peptidoglycan/LPS O-acetylase OafA/YrhL